MDRIKRKRVTRVGSGAFSIYLPKRWIDDWTPEQQEQREVDLHLIGQGILITPVLFDARQEATIEPSKKAVRRWLLSTYLRGAHQVRLFPEGDAFGNEAITAGRDFLRHLDERLVGTCTPQEIGFTLKQDLPPPFADPDDLIAVMATKVDEMISLASDAVATYGLDPQRCFHSLRLLQATFDEDVSRYLHQAMRMVATIEIPVRSVPDFQYLDLIAADLHRMGDHAQRIAKTLLRAQGLEAEDLQYPVDHLMTKVEGLPPMGDVARQIIRTYPQAFDEASDMLRALLGGLAARDAAALADLIGPCHEAQDRIQQRIFATVADNWGKAEWTTENATAGFTAYALSLPITNIFGAIRTVAQHSVGLVTAAPP